MERALLPPTRQVGTAIIHHGLPIRTCSRRTSTFKASLTPRREQTTQQYSFISRTLRSPLLAQSAAAAIQCETKTSVRASSLFRADVCERFRQLFQLYTSVKQLHATGCESTDGQSLCVQKSFSADCAQEQTSVYDNPVRPKAMVAQSESNV
jgi:hypothetical protein